MSLSAADILAIRTQYIRDLYTAANGAVPAVTLSHYNRAVKAQFISDADLQGKADRVTRAFYDELSGVYQAEYDHQIKGGATSVAADAAALLLQSDAFFRLIRASVFEDMMLDPGFVGSIADEKARSSMFAMWVTQILKDRQFTKQRTSAALRSVPLERF